MKLRHMLAVALLLITTATVTAAPLERDRDRDRSPVMKRIVRVLKWITQPLDHIIVPPHP